MPPAERPARRFVRVIDVTLPTPRAVRVVARGDLADWPDPGAAASLETYLPDTPVGPVSRIYTVRDWDPARGEVTFEMRMNEGFGPATQWAARVVAGMWLEVALGPSRFTPSPDASRYLFAGDGTSLPAIVTCVASLAPGSRAVAILAVEDEQEQQPFETLADLDVRWLHGDGDRGNPGALADATTGAVAEFGPDVVWIAGEADLIGGVRAGLLEHGFPSARLSAHEYWRRGEPDYREPAVS